MKGEMPLLIICPPASWNSLAQKELELDLGY